MNSITGTSAFARVVARSIAADHFFRVVTLSLAEEITEGLLDRDEVWGWANEAVLAETDSVIDALNVLGPTWVGSWDDLVTSARICAEVEA